MKTTAVLIASCLLLCLLSGSEGTCLIGDKEVEPGTHIYKCNKYTCHESGAISALGCPLLACHNQAGYQEEDLSKPYPECCARPICA